MTSPMTDLPDNDDSSSSRSASTNSSTESPSSSLLSVGINDLEPPTPTRPPVQQSRNRVIRHVQSILREHYLCFVLIWILLVLALAITTFVSFIEMLIVFRRHHDDQCDVGHYFDSKQ